MTKIKAYAILAALAATSTLYPETTVNVNAVLGNKIRHDQTRVVSDSANSGKKVTASNKASTNNFGAALTSLMRKMQNR